MNMEEINEFLASFNTNSYNRSQIGNDKQLITNILEYLSKLEFDRVDIETLINQVAYLSKDRVNIPLFLELLNKSYSFINSYSMSDVIKIVLEVHNVYYSNTTDITLEKYIHDTAEERTRKIFLNRNSNYLEKDFNSESLSEYICDLKLAAAICLDGKEYKEFISFINSFSKYQKFYSPLINFQIYNKIRNNLKGKSKLFWDIYYGNEYIVSLSKNNINLRDVYKENIINDSVELPESLEDTEQLDLFSYQDIKEREVKSKKDIKTFQICTIYNYGNMPTFTKEKDMINYFQTIINNEKIILPKLKEKENIYLYDYTE